MKYSRDKTADGTILVGILTPWAPSAREPNIQLYGIPDKSRRVQVWLCNSTQVNVSGVKSYRLSAAYAYVPNGKRTLENKYEYI